MYARTHVHIHRHYTQLHKHTHIHTYGYLTELLTFRWLKMNLKSLLHSCLNMIITYSTGIQYIHWKGPPWNLQEQQ